MMIWHLLRAALGPACLAASLALAACTPASPAAPSAREAAPAAKEANAEWDQLVAAAQQEGRLVIFGPDGAERRDALVLPFEEEYGISVEYTSGNAVTLAPRVDAERQAGQYAWDIIVAGALDKLIGPMNVLAPVEANLVVAENKDPSLWRGGELEFANDARTVLVMTPFRRGTLFINTNMVQPGELTSYKDLLDPKWTGQMVAHDPRIPGPGQATFFFFYQQPDLGPDFIRALGAQELSVMRDDAQLIDSVGQGRVPIVIGASDSQVEERIAQGVPIEIVDTSTLAEGSDTNPGVGMVGILDRPANPNAAKLYLNWLLSQEGQTAFARGAAYLSGRLDVPTDHVPAWRLPQAGDIKTYGKATLGLQDEMAPLLTEIFGAP